MLLSHEIAESYTVTDLQVLTPQGFKAVTQVYKTIPLPVWIIRTESYTLRCSGHHLIKLPGGCEHVCHVQVGDVVETEVGLEPLIEVSQTDEFEEMYDLTVDCPTGLFYSSGICSHNSTTFVARQRINSSIVPGYKSMYVVPFPEHMRTYARRYSEMESYFRVPDLKQNMYNKIYENGSALDIIYALTTADKSRGKTVDEVLIDEAQNMDASIIDELLYVQTVSKIPSTIYAGTALNVDTLLETKWQSSSQGMWHVRSGDGRRWLNMYDKETLFKVCDNPQGPTCPYTGKLLDVTNGGYVHANPGLLNIGAVGIHVPQCIIPDLVYNRVLWSKIYAKVKKDDPKSVLQECFGIAVSEGSREISIGDLMRLCVITDSKEQLKEKARTGYYKLIVSGCDWGGSDHNPATKSKLSYTVHCILGVAPDGEVDILHYRRYAGMDYREIVYLIAQEHKAWGAHVIASDAGVGYGYNAEIRNHIPSDTHFIMSYTGPKSAPLATVKDSHMPNHLALNRTEALTKVFNSVKQTYLRIRCQAWEVIGDYMQDWLNIHRVVQESTHGTKLFKYNRDASKSDDSLHAFTFAYALVLFYTGESIVQEETLEQALRSVVYAHEMQAYDTAYSHVTNLPMSISG